jgi:DNA polymerase III alpha subunit
VANGVPAEAAKEQWVHLAKFNAYSFCKSHAASYAQLAWAAAYLKAHYPLEFWVAALNNNQGMYEPRVYIEEIKRSGIAVLPPRVNRSEDEFSVDGDPPEFRRERDQKDVWHMPGDFWLPLWPPRRIGRTSEPAIRVGLSQIAGLSAATRERILACRPFKSLEDFVARMPAGPEELALLVRAGAFDFTGRPRPELLLEARMLARGRSRRAARPGGKGRGLFEGQAEGPHGSGFFEERFRLGEYSALRRVRDELELFGFTLGPHLMSFYRPFLPAELSDSRQIGERVGERIRLAGLVATAKHVVTQQGGLMQFITFEDEHGLFEVAVFPDMAGEFEHLRLGPYLITGQVEERLGDITIRAVELALLEELRLDQGWQRLAERQCTRLKPTCSVPPRLRLTGRVAA